MSLYLGENKIADNTCSRNIGEIIQSTIPLTDAGLHLLDGALISNVGSYAKFVNYIAGLVSNYPDLFTTEANWQSAVTTYGVCGKFVYDSVNNTVRLPKITGFVEGTTDVTALGDLVEAGLPNITGYSDRFDSNSGWQEGIDLQGAFYKQQLSTSGKTTGDSGGSFTWYRFGLDASRSNPIYGNSSTVQPQSIKVLYYIVIANSVKTNIEVDIDEVMTDLNGKADVDLSNVNANGTSLASGWSMPSSRYINLTLGASGANYTAPANGYVTLQKLSTASNQMISMYTLATDTHTRTGYRVYSSANGQYLLTTLPVKKGEKIYVTYDSSSTTGLYFRFVYAKGEGEN